MTLTDLKVVAKLVLSHIRHRPARMLLTLMSTVAAACVVVWVVSSYDSLVVKFDEFADNYLGRYEFVIMPSAGGTTAAGPFGAPAVRLTAELIESLKSDPAIAVVDSVLQTRARITKVGAEPPVREANRGGRNGPAGERSKLDDAPAPVSTTGDDETTTTRTSNAPGMGPGGFAGGLNRTPMLVGTNAAEAPYRLLEGRWIDGKVLDTPQAAISSGAAEQMKVKVGDQVTVAGFNSNPPWTFTIVGIVEQRKPLPTTPPIIGLPAMRGPPLTRGPATAALYVPLGIAEEIVGVSQRFDLAGVILKKGVSQDDFKRNWMEKLAAATPASTMQSIQEVDAELDNSTTSETVRSQAYSATGISLLAALFIIFSTLSMGVDERIRQLAVLRAVSLTRTQVATMIVLESLILGLIGWGGGLLAGWGLLKLVAQSRPDLFPVGSSLGAWCVVMSGACSMGGALAAAVLPAWKATRVKPLEAMSPQAAPPARISWTLTVLGLVLITMNPLLVFWIPMPDQSRYLASAAIGCTCMGIGFVLLAPATVLLTERFFAPLVARFLFVNPKLLATQLSTNLWRTLGATVALTLGLGLFVAMQTWGYSMLGPFTPGDWVPDAVVVLSLPDSEVDAVLNLPGIATERSLPCVSEQVKFSTDVTGSKIRATSSRQDNCVMVGVDPDRGLGGAKPVFPFTFVNGTRDEALEKLKQGRYCLVPDHFERESGLTVGGKFGVILPDAPDQEVEYEIAGVVAMPGWHWMSKVGLRNRGGGRSAGLMFASFNQVRKDFHLDRVNAFWLNGESPIVEDELKAALLPIAERNPDRRSPGRGRGGMPGGGGGPGGMGARGGGMPGGFDPRGAGAARRGGPSIQMRTREGVRIAIRERADGIIWLLSRLPLVTLAVTSLGIVNTIVSSIRARQWDLGVMRAVGLTRFGLFRMILSEAVLVAAAACLLSLGFGLMAGYCGTGVTRYVNVRGGQIVSLIIPWYQIGIGFGITLGLCLIAALWPAFRTGRVEPLRLLQAGRAAT
jgi:putative ABC transport system permease protein